MKNMEAPKLLTERDGSSENIGKGHVVDHDMNKEIHVNVVDNPPEPDTSS
jgi:hypothetical protein